MRRFIAHVDMDCDGPQTCIHRIDIPAGLEDSEAATKAVELGQISHLYPADPSEWFTIPVGSTAEDRAIAIFADHRANRSEMIRNYGSARGNIFR